MAKYSPTTVARFWSKVEVGDPATCWTWRARKNEKGYGVFRDKKAHRVAYNLLIGKIPDGQICCHKCDNPSCCNPHHIFLGSHADNIRDARDKGRLRGMGIAGERHPNAKLTDLQVEEIRSSPLTGAALARKFGVSPSTISGVRTYTHRL